MKISPRGWLYYISIYVVVFNVLDFLTSTLVNHKTFQFDPIKDLVAPVAIASIIFLVKSFRASNQ